MPFFSSKPVPFHSSRLELIGSRCLLAGPLLTLLTGSLLVGSLLTGCLGRTSELETPGLRVEDVASWGEAAAVGIEPGDRIESWRTATAEGAATDPLELLWIEWDESPRAPVILTVRRGDETMEKYLGDFGWEMTLRPALSPSALAIYDQARTANGDRPEVWRELEGLVAGQPGAAAWAVWRHGVAAATDPERLAEAREAFERARGLVVDRPHLVALLHAEEGRALWAGTQYAAAADPFAEATAALRALDPVSPFLAINLDREARQGHYDRRLDATRTAYVEAEQILGSYPRAHNLRIAIAARRATIALTEGENEVAIEAYRAALALVDRSGDPYHANLGLDLGSVLRDQGEYEEAAEWYRRALKLSGRTPRERVVLAAAYNKLGILNKHLGNYGRAERYYRRALELFPRGGAAEAGIRNNLGNLGLRRGDFVTAVDDHRVALDIRLALQPDSLSVASSYHNLATALSDRGQLDKADEFFTKAHAIKSALAPDSLLLARTLREWGVNDIRQRHVADATRRITLACETAQTVAPDSFDLAECTLRLGDAKLADGDRRQAMEAWRQGLEMAEGLRTGVPSEQGKARFSAMFDDYYRKLADGFLEDGEAEQALLTLEAARGRMLRALLEQQGDRAAWVASPAVLEARRRTDAGIARTRGRLLGLHPVNDAERVREIHQQLRDLESEREELNERLYSASSDLERLERSTPVTVSRLRAHLPAGSVGLLYALGEERSHVFVVYPEGAGPEIVAVPLDISRDDVERRVELFRGLLERGREVPDLEPAAITQGSKLFDDLLAPLADHLALATSLYISPDTVLNGLPFAALIRSREPLQFLAEWKPHAMVSSLSSLAELRRAQGDRRPAEHELVAIGAPDLSRTQATERTYSLGSLPGAAEEIRKLAELFGDRALALTGPQATEAATRDALPTGRYVHFATHALLDRRFPMSSSLVLSASENGSERDDGQLHGWEILENPELAAELVILAGCETGRGALWDGEGLIGLAQAFHYVGTPTVLASQWRIGDTWVAELTTEFYRQLLAGREPMRALAEAQRRLITLGDDDSVLGHPYYWASFTLFGLGE